MVRLLSQSELNKRKVAVAPELGKVYLSGQQVSARLFILAQGLEDVLSRRLGGEGAPVIQKVIGAGGR